MGKRKLELNLRKTKNNGKKQTKRLLMTQIQKYTEGSHHVCSVNLESMVTLETIAMGLQATTAILS